MDILGLEVGYRLISLVDKAQDGELLRNQGRTEEIRARDRLSAAPGAYPRQP